VKYRANRNRLILGIRLSAPRGSSNPASSRNRRWKNRLVFAFDEEDRDAFSCGRRPRQSVIWSTGTLQLNPSFLLSGVPMAQTNTATR